MTTQAQGSVFGPTNQTKSQQQAVNQQQPQEALAVQKDVVDSVLAKINTFEENGELKLPANYSAPNALKSAWLILQDAVDKNNQPVLVSCTRESIANSLLSMVVQGLSPVKNQCYFIPYGKELQLQRSYLGTLAVAKRVGGVKTAVANCIYEGDKFVYSIDPETGLKKIVEHTQDLENLDADKVKGAYAILTTEDGRTIVEIMNMGQIRKAWMQGSMKGGSPAHKNFGDEMAKKSVLGRACKMLIGISDDADLYDEQDIETMDNVAGQRNANIAANANKKAVKNIEDASFEEVGHTEASCKNIQSVTENKATASPSSEPPY
uniref:recombinase RecT n=1 Tax=Parabacteroides distasonis TaxID=823 RepID=UPI00402616E0